MPPHSLTCSQKNLKHVRESAVYNLTYAGVLEAGITEEWQLTVLMRVPQYNYMLSVNLRSAPGAEEILHKATSALYRLPSTEQISKWDDNVCRRFLKKGSDLWAELGPVVTAMSTYVPRAAKSLWDELSDTSLEARQARTKICGSVSAHTQKQMLLSVSGISWSFCAV